jgi:hypothetical protein
MARGIREMARGIREMARGIREMARGIREMARGICLWDLPDGVSEWFVRAISRAVTDRVRFTRNRAAHP